MDAENSVDVTAHAPKYSSGAFSKADQPSMYSVDQSWRTTISRAASALDRVSIVKQGGKCAREKARGM